jgi:hypothetical protein
MNVELDNELANLEINSADIDPEFAFISDDQRFKALVGE